MTAVILLSLAVCVIVWLVRTPPGYKRPERDWSDRLADWMFDDRHGWRPFGAIIGGILIWALILDAVFGLANLRRLLGWTLY